MGEKPNIRPLCEWGLFPESRPCIIAGPCAAESREQVLSAAAALRDLGVGVFRAGVWKPRTRPGAFAGAGAEALDWLGEVQATGMKVCTEVACAQHVRECLDAGVDALWVGARTTTNPFLVQEIADAIASYGNKPGRDVTMAGRSSTAADVAVFVKNPVNPDISLWIGALERFAGAGVDRIAAVHRGFTPSDPQRYRNDPMWRLAVQLRTMMPGLPLLCDPSHIAGKAEYVTEIALRALNLGLDGLMVEVHPDPENALSDAAQQLSPEAFAALLDAVASRYATDGTGSSEVLSELASLRERIDICDEALIRTLAERMDAVREIGRCKKENHLAIMQASRWDEVLGRAVSAGRKAGLDAEFVREIFSLVHQESVRTQEEASPDGKEGRS